MISKEKIWRYIGGFIAIAGLGIAASFHATRPFVNPLAFSFVNSSILNIIMGTFAGLVVLAAGLWIIGHPGSPKEDNEDSRKLS